MTVQSVRPGRVALRIPPRGGIRLLVPLAMGLDVVLVSTSVAAAYVAREALPPSIVPRTFDAESVVGVVGPWMVVGWVLAIHALGGHRQQVFGAGLDEYKRVLSASMLTAASLGIACYLLRFELARGFFLLAFLIGMPSLVVGRVVLRRGVQRARARGNLQLRVLIAGTEGHVDEIASVLRREAWLGYQVVGALTPVDAGRPTTGLGVPLLGRSTTLADQARLNDVDVVFLAGGAFSSAVELRRLAWELEHEAVQVVIAPGVTDVAAERVRIRPVGGLPLIHLEKPRTSNSLRRAKRAFDAVGSLLLLAAFGPLVIIAALRIRRHDGGPVLFRQPRVGRDGRVFICFKLRTMVCDAEERRAALVAQSGHGTGLFKMAHDPRVTAPGRWLRRFSIDELPQLFNVLRGDMSLVGPRPPLEHEVAQYDDDMARRLRARPGMTGLWQVSGRSELSWSEAIRLDLYYVDNWSMLQDLTILFRTMRAVLGSRGAY